MRQLRLAMLVSGRGSTMENIAEAIGHGRLEARIGLVIASNPACLAVERAQRRKYPVDIITRKESGTLEEFSRRIADSIRRANVDLSLMAGFLSLWQIPPDLQNRVMNIHPALLPKYGGKGMHGEHVHAAVLASGDTESGCTVHFANNAYDEGPIILQRRVRVLPGDTPATLAQRVFAAECQAYPDAIRWFAEQP